MPAVRRLRRRTVVSGTEVAPVTVPAGDWTWSPVSEGQLRESESAPESAPETWTRLRSFRVETAERGTGVGAYVIPRRWLRPEAQNAWARRVWDAQACGSWQKRTGRPHRHLAGVST